MGRGKLALLGLLIGKRFANMQITMAVSPEIAGLEAFLKERNVAPRQAFKDAAVAYSNWSRWRRGVTSPNVDTLRRIREAVDPVKPNASV
jgi:predicted transcriptional regulator